MSFVRYNPEDSVLSSETVVRGLFTAANGGDTNTLGAGNFVTQSGYTEYYLDVYNALPSSSGSVQFAIQYGNINGSGSNVINTSTYTVGKSPSRIVYGEYRNLVYGTENQNFSFNNGATTGSDIFVINYARARYKESLLPGSFNLKLAYGSASIQLTDDSNTTSLTRFIGENRYYNIVSGSNGNYYNAAASQSYGFMFPDLDIIVLDATPFVSSSALYFIGGLYTTASLATSSFTTASYNTTILYRAMASSSLAQSMTLQSEETVSSRYFFTRVKNSDFNYTTNPSIIDDNGNLLYTTLINNPQTYITTVGMYNDNNELLAVAKLSRPLTKDFTKEALIRIKLDY